ncbi:MAG: AarF/UbiB family protein [Sediminicola sp.]|tara:strand:- start:25394 stop:26704 length:1311 start_codon:yes stop_codon:yes gene_type:complete
MKTLDSIPTGKIARAGTLVHTGVKVGGNYMKYYGKKLLDPTTSREGLDGDNAEDIYNSLKTLKGSALKVAQMLSMEKNMLPSAYVEKFSLSQFSVPALSAPLVRKTFKKYLGKYPEELFDVFQKDAVNAASIGQVHRAVKDGHELAVKIQYPGVAESIGSDLALVKPIASRMFNLQGKDAERYFKEVENKLVEETDYLLELRQGEEISQACSMVPNMVFPSYYPDLSSDRILTMDWMEGVHLGEFTKTDFDPLLGHRLGQALWDFYMLQIHGLRKVHADPHPGNFLVGDGGELIALDFGCVKELPAEFYIPYFELAKRDRLGNDVFYTQKLHELEILSVGDTAADIKFFKELFKEMLTIFTAPFQEERFDFGAEGFWSDIASLAERFTQDPRIRKMNGARGSQHFLYMNRTFFGLFNLLHDLKASVEVNNYKKYLD